MRYSPFVPLRVFSAYTMLDGAIEPKAFAKIAKDLGFPAIAMTDRNGLYGAMAFADSCRSAGIQPIIGTMLSVRRPGSVAAGSAPHYDWLALYAQDAEGFQNLCHLVSAAHLDRPVEDVAHVPLEALSGYSEGLIALTAAGEGAVARLLAEGQEDAAKSYLADLQRYFPDRLYIELARRGDPVEQAAEMSLIDMAYAQDLPLVATNPACYADPVFHAAREAMLCIANGGQVDAQQLLASSPDGWVKSARMMAEIFADLPEALANTLVVAQRCAVTPPDRKPILPSLAGDTQAEAAQLRSDAYAGLERRLADMPAMAETARQVYFDRLAFETDVIINMGFPGYFLIVADFIKWAKEKDIPVGPGRGSGAGSVVAWALTITDLDPLQFGLLFERFLNPARISMPDFDIDFCETRRGEVIRYVQAKYGRDHVAQIITFGKLKARAVLRDVGRVLGMPYGQVDRLCKLIPNHPTDPWDLKRALSGVSELAQEYDSDEDVKRLFDLAAQLEGLPRHSSTHAAGVVIGDRPLAQLVPLYRDPRSDMPVTQYDMKYAEQAGLVKFDFLGLKTLSVLQRAIQMLDRLGVTVDLGKLPLDDAAVYELLQRGDTVGVFQLESEGMRRTLALVKPTEFGDIIALVSLYRPGPMDNIPSFGARKNGREDISYPHPLLADILAETYGIIVYQEQVMQAAQVIAGYSLGEADLLRRAMGKKIKAEMDKQRDRFVAGAAANDIGKSKADELFDLIAKFADYGFNKSHAAAYALLAYQTAWLKTHHPQVFFAASMCFDMHQSDKLGVFTDDMRKLDIACLPPCINHSEGQFSVEKHGDTLAVRYALAGLKNVGDKAMAQLVAERTAAGPFASIDDFAKRIDPGLLNKRQVESLAAAGAFDIFGCERAAIYKAAETLMAVSADNHASRMSGQGGLFGEEVADAGQAIRLTGEIWATGQGMAMEREAFGFFFSAHPVGQYAALAKAKGARSYAELMDGSPMQAGGRRPAVMAAMVESVQRRKTKRGKDYVNIDLSDASGQFSASCFEENLVDQLQKWGTDAACLLLNVELDSTGDDQPPRITIRSARPLESIAPITPVAPVAQPLLLCLDVERAGALQELSLILSSKGLGSGEVQARLAIAPDHEAVVHLGSRFNLAPDLLDLLTPVAGLANIDLSAKKPRLHAVQ